MRGCPMQIELCPEEHALLQRIAQQSKPRYVRRARVVLGCADGQPLSEVAQCSGLSQRRVRFWMRRFEEQRMAVFPPSALPADPDLATEATVPQAEAGLPASPAAGEMPEESPREAPVVPSLPLLAVDDLLAQYGVDLAHAWHVAELALQLYDLTQEVHNLDGRWRALLEAAALLHEVGMGQGDKPANRAGRQIILQQELAGLADDECERVAWIVYLQEGSLRRAKSKLRGTSGRVQRGLLATAALLRMADGLDAARTQSCRIEGVRRVDEGLQIVIGGVDSPRDALSASDRAGLWHKVSDLPIAFRSLEPMSASLLALVGSPVEAGRKALPGIQATDPMSEAGRKAIRLHFARMLAHERGTRLGEDIEELHDMRVATRRMRAAFRVFEGYYDPKAISPLIKGLRRTARVLGGVRDLDVFMQKAARYQEACSQEERPNLEPLYESWHLLRERRREEMLAHLDSEGYRAFCLRLAEFVQSPGAGALAPEGDEPTPSLVAHVAPFAIYHRWAEVMAFAPFLGEAPLEMLHALRIHAKLLRYTLEFFQEVLGPKAKAAIERVVALQDHLGDLQDACVASDMLRDFVNRWAEEQKTRSAMQRVEIHGVTQYLAAQQEQMHTLLEAFPAAWAAFNSEAIRQELAAAIAVL